ncbi:carbohydate-binding domain-containing protein [Microbulbifer sp. CAU 1566]|uniref:family 20 glycosylhydrolase n=1 Tax=Microbulbifer sp. CAU 1566 TaxID=2933269 RepID=UPI002006277F|nr:family 20 glycosylhydrolase [Microbulbifer sp. CAU 1566]MCK7598202.1 carbohydate-binding domain-containing protein [Microbulbifer sp. CAU 1566]
MKRLPFFASLALSAFIASCADSESPNKTSSIDASVAARIAANFDVTQEVLTNFQGADEALRAECKKVGGSAAACFTYRISLINKGPAVAAGERDWTLYFHSVRRSLALLNSDAFTLERVNGDLHRLVPTEKFDGIAAGETLELDLLAESWVQFESDFQPRLFVVGADGEAQVIASTDTDDLKDIVLPINKNSPDNWKRAADDGNTLATAASRYQQFTADAEMLAKTSTVGDSEAWRGRIIPKPASVALPEGAAVHLEHGISLVAEGVDENTIEALNQRLAQLELLPQGDAAYPLQLAVVPDAFNDKPAGAYRLEVGPEGAQVTAAEASGAFYGVQSLLALVDLRSNSLPQALVEDAPRFPHRGFFLDVGRNFHSKDVVLKLLDQMAAYKLNRFHFHLSDDEGWRLEIPGLPELTDIGSQRCFDLEENRCLLPQLGSGPKADNFGSGYFSVDDYVEILRYAAARHIEVVPEFDMPAHARSAVVAMEARYRKLKDSDPAAAEAYRLIDPQDDTQYLSVQFYDDSYINPCVDSTYHFVGKLIREVKAMHDTAGHPLKSWHFGGDEAVNILASDSFEVGPGQNPEKGDVVADKRNKPWTNSPQCQKLIADGEVKSIDELGELYAKRVSQMVADAGIPTMAAWNDGVKKIESAEEELATEHNYVNSWAPLFWGGGDESAHFAETGFDLVQSHSDYLYFDMPQEVDPKERGYYWASRYTDTRKTFSYAPLNTAQLAEVYPNRDGKSWTATSPEAEFAGSVRGIQGQLWSEVVRTDEAVEYQVFPRLLALAERAWHQASWELPLKAGQTFSGETTFVDQHALARDWLDFSAALGNKELLKLDRAGIGYRVPVPGAVAQSEGIQTALPYPGLQLEYFDGAQWAPFTDDVAPESVVSLRARSADGQRAGRAVEIAPAGVLGAR